ncbi:uncharacterized protein LOC113518666 [Galleria mellonella]|uniref:Uncharacterized protein LOC113518666 n=1 Tax=Galleria mellonella TaxID=7137 RepID=A0ABM3MN44_GALME|nr:uncharacterized protein LOC113518666 [Galleria mellonella]
MWLNLIVVLAFVAASVAGDRYSDYSAAKMPQYEGGDYDAPRDSVASAVLESEDYQGHSPDASASPDYKYEGELKEKQIKSSLKEVESEDLWQRPVRQQRSRSLIDNDDYIEIDKLSPEDVIPKLKSRYRYAKHRPRHKSWKSDRDVRINNNNRDENEEVNDTESEEFRDKVDFRRNKNKNLEDNVNYEHKVTTNKIIRRKPRRLTAGLRTSRPVHDIEEDIGDILPDRRLKEDEASDDDFSFDAPPRNRLGNNRYRPSDDEDIVVKLHKNKLKQGSYSEYNDYYDMKRVNNIKNKLPTLLQRTKARASAPRPTSLLEDLFPGRRANNGYITIPEVVTEVLKTTTSSTETSSLQTSTTTIATITSSIMAMSNLISTTNTSKELSLAEKSKLSILKKAQRKESFKSLSTTKPPVLLQVTRKLPTVVMVEPPETNEPWLRAREVSDDAPEHLDKVKRLMRKKLIANAKNIQDLTDNWDDLVCDYIDTALLENGASFLYTNYVKFCIILYGTIGFSIMQLDFFFIFIENVYLFYNKLNVTGVDETWAPSMANVAERELTALLSAHHHLKDVASSTSYSPASNIRTLETLSAKALDPRVRREWDAFIAANNSQNCVFSLSIAFLALLYNLQRYN